jgi:hypothetical protein
MDSLISRHNLLCYLLFTAGLLCFLFPLGAQDNLFFETGDTAVALRYLEWAEGELEAGRNAQALAGLERGADYAAASSDLSYLLALVRSMEGRSRGSVLEACRHSLETDRWIRYTPEAARLLEAKTLIDLRRFEEALDMLRNGDPELYETRYLRLRALAGQGAEAEFRRDLAHMLERFPRRTEPVRLFFEYEARRENSGGIHPLLNTILRRLPLLVDLDPELAYLAVPFLRPPEEARRYVAAYRAAGKPNPASLPAALNLGLVEGKAAVDELFNWRETPQGERLRSPAVLDRDLVISVWTLLRSGEERAYLNKNLLQFSGVITEDRDNDGIVEAKTLYREGMIQEYSCDQDQDGLADLFVRFAQGLPAEAEIAMAGNGEEVLSLGNEDRPSALLRWERYPAVLHTELKGKRYIPRPLDYFYTPFRLMALVPENQEGNLRPSGSAEFPVREDPLPVLSERSLLSFAAILEQPSAEFSGGTERVELEGGLPLKSSVIVQGKTVARTEYRLGRPFIQYIDLDLDGRMETVRRYDSTVAWRVAVSESDWDGDGIFEYAEALQSDGTMKKSWDLNRDGIRETEE